jgi:hypothetical protein
MLVIIRKYFLAILILFVCVFFCLGMALVEVETRKKNRSRSRSNRTNLSSVLASSFLTFLCCEPPCVQPVDFDFTTLSYLKPIACASRHRSITLPRFFNHTRERTRSLNKSPSKRSYAFVEFRSRRDAEDAYYEMYVLFFI